MFLMILCRFFHWCFISVSSGHYKLNHWCMVNVFFFLKRVTKNTAKNFTRRGKKTQELAGGFFFWKRGKKNPNNYYCMMHEAWSLGSLDKIMKPGGPIHRHTQMQFICLGALRLREDWRHAIALNDSRSATGTWREKKKKKKNGIRLVGRKVAHL